VHAFPSERPPNEVMRSEPIEAKRSILAVQDELFEMLLPRSVVDGLSRGLGDGHHRRGSVRPRSAMAITARARAHRHVMVIAG
jgi:hypothetical protein